VKVTIVIPTFGDEEWAALALERALPSAETQGCEVVIGHDPGGTASSTRNDLALRAHGDYVCFLDADDELGPGYIEAMRRAYERERRDDGTPLLLTPAIKRVGRRHTPAHLIPECSLINANWLVISTLVPRDLFLQVGGFPEYPIYEDWALMCKLAQAGAHAVQVSEAVLTIHEGRRLGRNSAMHPHERTEWHFRIGADLWPEHYDQLRYRKMLARLPRKRRMRQ